MSRWLVLCTVAVAIGLVLWLKPRPQIGMDDGREAMDAAGASTRVLLFADPTEAESSCGCGEIIRLAREVGEHEDVSLSEIDTRKDSDQARRYKVRVSPTVIIAERDGTERARFEGESAEIIEKLRAALAPLTKEEPARGDDGAP
jgi:hypothetical protein